MNHIQNISTNHKYFTQIGTQFYMKKEHKFHHLNLQKVTIITKARKPTSRKSDYSLMVKRRLSPLP